MKESGLYQNISRRTLILGGGQLVLVSILIGKMFQLQILRSDKFKKLSDKNKLKIDFQIPYRGEIKDRNGVLLVGNKPIYSAMVVPEEALVDLDVEIFIKNLEQFIELSDEDVEEIKKDINKKKEFLDVMIKENMSWKEMAEIESRHLDFPGVFVKKNYMREYFYKDVGAHVLGHMGRPSIADLKNDGDILLRMPSVYIGKMGSEKFYDKALRGEVGKKYKVVNSVGRVVDRLNYKDEEAVNGETLDLCIDNDIQKVAQEAFNKRKFFGGATVMDIKTGEILSMVSAPTFDPNIFHKSLMDRKIFNDLNTNIFKPFNNKNTDMVYPPASTFKIVVALAGLEEGLINKNTRVFCNGKFPYGNRIFHCWEKKGHGSVNVIDALAESCDVFFYELGLKLGIEKIRKYAEKFGFSELSDIDLPGEIRAVIPGKDWKKKTFDQSWRKGDTLNSSIGQGYCLTTNMQLLNCIARVANGGIKVKPHLKKKSNLGNFEKIEGVSKANLDIIREGLFKVINSSKGTARGSRFDVNGMKLAGKTGTAQVRSISMAERRAGVRNEDLAIKKRHHALFCGYAPFDNPKYAISVIVEHGVSGGNAARIASDIMKFVLKKDLK